MDIQVANAHNEIRNIKIKLELGKITYDDAKEQAMPHLDLINEKGREVARRFKKPYYPLTFSGAMR